jgi:hypothetical protein
VFKKVKISKILILTLFFIPMLFFYFLPLSSAHEDNKQLNNSEYKEISDPAIRKLTNDSLFIAHRGTLPEAIDQKWENSIVNCWLNLTRMGPLYSEFDISIKSFASNNKVIIIELDPAYKEEINDSRIDEIYRKINDYCEQHEGISEIPVVFMWASEYSTLPDYGPQVFEEAKKLPGFITTRGSMPEIHQEEEKRKWLDLLINDKRSLPLNSTTGIKQYSAEIGGPIISFGTNINGYLILGFEEYTPEKVNESVINEIYQVIDKHFEQEGISKVPVVFVFDHITVDEGAPADGPDANKSNDTNTLGNKEKIVGNKTTNQISGFTSIMVIIGLLFMLIIR